MAKRRKIPRQGVETLFKKYFVKILKILKKSKKFKSAK
jgi:hypothetical protein